MIYLAVLAAVGWLAAALLLGLWLGERGRRRGAEWERGIVAPKKAHALPTAPDAEEGLLALDPPPLLDPKRLAPRLKSMKPDLSADEAAALAERVSDFYAGSVP